MIINNQEYDNEKIKEIMEFIFDSKNELVDSVLQKIFEKEEIDKPFYDSQKIEVLNKIWDMTEELTKKDIYRENKEEIDLDLVFPEKSFTPYEVPDYFNIDENNDI